MKDIYSLSALKTPTPNKLYIRSRNCSPDLKLNTGCNLNVTTWLTHSPFSKLAKSVAKIA